jgi:CRISPR/Cas system CSM-associated protein Csm5 (group 7 of RAMP superfamily)
MVYCAVLGKSVHTIKFTHRRILQVSIHKHTAKILMENTKNHVVRNFLPTSMETFQQNVFIISNKVIRIVTHLNLEYPTPELQGTINTYISHHE